MTSRPAQLSAFLWLAVGCLATAVAAPLTVSVKQRNDKPLIGAVVTLESTRLPAAAPLKAIMDQVNLAFVPDVLVVPEHSSVQFPNSDAISHQVYSFSSARKFQLPLYRGKPYPPVVFEHAGVITLGCNIHDNMLAYIVVTRAPFYGRTDDKGEWSVPHLPDGNYSIHLWHPLLNEPGEVARDFETGSQAAVELRLAHELKPAPLSGRPRSWEY